MLLVQGIDFDSYDDVEKLVSEYSLGKFCGKDLIKSKLLYSVEDIFKYKVGDEVSVDFDGDGFLIWDGEVSGIFDNKLMVYIY